MLQFDNKIGGFFYMTPKSAICSTWLNKFDFNPIFLQHHPLYFVWHGGGGGLRAPQGAACGWPGNPSPGTPWDWWSGWQSPSWGPLAYHQPPGVYRRNEPDAGNKVPSHTILYLLSNMANVSDNLGPQQRPDIGHQRMGNFLGKYSDRINPPPPNDSVVQHFLAPNDLIFPLESTPNPTSRF